MVCEDLCHGEYNAELCNGFWYNRTSSECILSTVLMKNDVSAVDGPCEKDSIEYYEKQVILGKLSKCHRWPGAVKMSALDDSLAYTYLSY